MDMCQLIKKRKSLAGVFEYAVWNERNLCSYWINQRGFCFFEGDIFVYICTGGLIDPFIYDTYEKLWEVILIVDLLLPSHSLPFVNNWVQICSDILMDHVLHWILFKLSFQIKQILLKRKYLHTQHNGRSSLNCNLS